MVKRIIGLAGKSGSGKDVVADHINEKYGYKKVAVADALKLEVYDQLLNPSGDFLRILQELGYATPMLELPIPQLTNPTNDEKIAWINDHRKFLRNLLQYYGTEYRCSQDSDYWVKQLVAKMSETDFVVVSDVRLPIEMDAVYKAGGEVWLVTRTGVEPVGIPGHLTEVGLDGATFDRIIANDTSLEYLKKKIDFIFHEG